MFAFKNAFIWESKNYPDVLKQNKINTQKQKIKNMFMKFKTLGTTGISQVEDRILAIHSVAFIWPRYKTHWGCSILRLWKEVINWGLTDCWWNRGGEYISLVRCSSEIQQEHHSLDWDSEKKMIENISLTQSLSFFLSFLFFFALTMILLKMIK